MKRYLVFGWDEYQRDGGLENLIGDCDSIDEVNQMFVSNNYEMQQVLDTKTGEKLDRHGRKLSWGD